MIRKRQPRTHIVLWKWTQPNERLPYEAKHVNVMAGMLARNITIDHRIICVTDRSDGITECETYPLWTDHENLANATKHNLPSCYRRLKLYDYQTQLNMGIDKGDRILGLDLDTVICGNIDQVLRTPGRFVGWGMKGTSQRDVFNGSFQMFTAGDLQEIWTKFDPNVSPKECFAKGWLGSDQSWLSMNLIGKEGSVSVGWPEVASYPLQVRLPGLKPNTRIVFFHGSVKPWFPKALQDSPFISRYWRT